MTITATELKTNLGKYLEMAMVEDVYITKNGRRIAKLCDPTRERVEMLDSLVGVAKDNAVGMSDDDIKSERLVRQ